MLNRYNTVIASLIGAILLCAPFSAFAANCTSLTNSIGGFWNLDESSGNASDATGNSNTLTNNNTVTYTTGLIGNGAVFAAASSQSLSISGASQTGLNPSATISVSLWVKFTTLPSSGGNYALVSRWGSTGTTQSYQLELRNTSGTYDLFWFINATAAYADYTWPSPSTGVWYHIVATFTPSATFTMYLNGSALSPTITGSSASIPTASTDFALGAVRDGGAGSRFLDAEEDMAGVWSCILTSSQVTSLYNGGAGIQYPFTPSTTATSIVGLVRAWWAF